MAAGVSLLDHVPYPNHNHNPNRDSSSYSAAKHAELNTDMQTGKKHVCVHVCLM